MGLMAASARAVRMAEPASAAVAPKVRMLKTIALRSIMALPLRTTLPNHIASWNLPPLKMPLWLTRAPGQRHQRHVMRVPYADRFGANAPEGISDRLCLADGDMQAEQRDRNAIGPFVKAHVRHRFEQHGAGQHDQRIGEDEIFDLESAPDAERID